MSTGATIQFNGMTYYQSHDGYPDDVIPEMKRLVVLAKELAFHSGRKRNCTFVGAMEAFLTESEDYDCSAVNGFPADYAFEIDNKGDVTQVEI
jgi:hypothetical protein